MILGTDVMALHTRSTVCVTNDTASLIQRLLCFQTSVQNRMAYYPQYPAFYAYPVPFPNQEFYALYPPNPAGHSGHIYYQDTAGNSNNMNVAASGIPYNNNMRAVDKFGYNNRKDSQDSGISELSDGSNSRKVSNSSTISNSSIAEEPGLDDVKEEDAPMVVPDDDLCVQIVQQVEPATRRLHSVLLTPGQLTSNVGKPPISLGTGLAPKT